MNREAPLDAAEEADDYYEGGNDALRFDPLREAALLVLRANRTSQRNRALAMSTALDALQEAIDTQGATLDQLRAERIDAEVLAQAIQETDHAAPVCSTRGPETIAWRFLSENERSLRLSDAHRIASEYARLAQVEAEAAQRALDQLRAERIDVGAWERAVIDVSNANSLSIYSTKDGVEWFDRRRFAALLRAALASQTREEGT